jgi:hypothetical protein
MTLTDMMQDLVERGCYPCCSYRGGGVYRAHINGAGNQWDEGRTPDSAMRKAFEAWKRNGKPMDGYACTGKPTPNAELTGSLKPGKG